MTDSSTPPDGSERTAARMRALTARAADQPEAGLRGAAAVRARESERLKSVGRGIALTDPEPRKGAASGQSSVRAPAPPPTSLARTQVQPSSTRAPSPPSSARAPAVRSRLAAEAGEPYPPLSEQVVNGITAASATAVKRPDGNRAAPRSPRDALEPDRIEMPARRSARARHPLVIAGNAVITLFLILAVAAGYVLYVGKQRFEAPGPLAQDRIVNIPRGSGLRDVSDVLARNGVIDQPWVFVAGVLLLKTHEGLKAGEYQFKAHASLNDVVTMLSEGKVLVHQISLPEGLTSEQIVQRLMDNDVLTGNIEEIPPEGSMLPDTYSFTRSTTRAQLILRMQYAQQRLLKDIWDRRAADLPIKTPEQLVILASLIEKETGRPDERTRIAAVFVNRLKQRMRLQSDPTIIYGLVGGKGSLGRPIMKSEIDQPTPYNTYQIDGLPPGPITNPGRASLEAAANPARTRDLYFVADGTGGHVFAETYEQHEKNVARLRQLQAAHRQQNAAAGQPTPADPAPAAVAATPAPKPAPHRKRIRRARPTQ